MQLSVRSARHQGLHGGGRTKLEPLEAALAAVLADCPPLPSAEADLHAALGRVLATDAVALLDVPRFDNSAMDGYAVRHLDLEARTGVVTVEGETAAGSPPGVLRDGGYARSISTGAPVPAEADTVVEYELVQVREYGTIAVLGSVAAGRNIRRRGEDLGAGDVVVPAGTLLRSRHLAALAAAGVRTVRAHRRPRVAYCSLGDELSAAWEQLAPGQIPDSNRSFLHGAITEADCEVIDGGTVGDVATRTAAVIGALAASHDAVVTTGGVGGGPHDFAAEALARLGRSRSFKLAVKPGKPFAFGVVHGTPVFCLPGNPFAALVGFELLVRPGLRCLAGKQADGHLRVRATCDGAFPHKPDGKRHYVPAVASQDLHGHWRVRPLGVHGSHRIIGVSSGDCLVVLEDNAAPGDAVTAILFPNWEPPPGPRAGPAPQLPEPQDTC